MLATVNALLASGYELNERERLAKVFGEMRSRAQAGPEAVLWPAGVPGVLGAPDAAGHVRLTGARLGAAAWERDRPGELRPGVLPGASASAVATEPGPCTAPVSEKKAPPRLVRGVDSRSPGGKLESTPRTRLSLSLSQRSHFLDCRPSPHPP